MERRLIYHMCRRAEWAAAEAAGLYRGSSQDAADGFIHFSTAEQIRESARKHGADQADLVLVTVDTAGLGAALRWEPSRGGALFPHLFGALPLEAVVRVDPLPLRPEGVHEFPQLSAERDVRQVAEIEAGLTEAKSGAPGVPHREVETWVRSWRTTRPQKRPRAKT